MPPVRVRSRSRTSPRPPARTPDPGPWPTLRCARAAVPPKENSITTADFEHLLRPAPGTEGLSSAHTRDATKSSSPSLMMLVLLATIGVLAYATFIFRPSHHGDLLPFALVVTAETFLIAQALLALWTILSSGYDARDFSYHQAKRSLFDPGEITTQGLEASPSLWPMRINDGEASVDVFVTTYGEDLDVIRRTVSAALAIRGRHRTLVLDDGRSEEVRELALELGAEYVRRPDNSWCQGREPQPRALDHRRRVLRRLRRRLRAEAGVLPRDAAVLRHRQGRLRPDAPDVRQPPHGPVPRVRLHAVGLLLPDPVREEPLQRRVLRGDERRLPPQRGRRHRRHLPGVEVRGHLDLDPPARARLAVHLHRCGAGCR